MLQYAITDRSRYTGTEQQRQTALVEQAQWLARQGMDFLQIREKDLDDDHLTALVRQIAAVLPRREPGMRLLLNGTPALARQAGADGVHLTFANAGGSQLTPLRIGGDLLVSAACHTIDEVVQAASVVDLILFAPVFEKQVGGLRVREGAGLRSLEQACQAAGTTPVLALGGVTEENIPLCLQAGAAGVAGIRLFAEPPETMTRAR